MGACRSKPKDEAETTLYEEKQQEAAQHEGRHLPTEPTPAWVEPGTTAKATADTITKAAGRKPDTTGKDVGAQPGTTAKTVLGTTAKDVDDASGTKATGTGAEPNGTTTISPALSKACIVFVLGGPGSGKGTQCEMIVEKYGFVHLSAGDLLREEVKKGTDLGKEIEGIMKEGNLVPTPITVKLLREAMEKSSSDTFLIDGFPREIKQAENFEREVKPPQLVIFYDSPEDVMLERLLKRAKTSGRADDNEETIRKRFKTFLECTMPVVEHYERQGKLVKISAVPPPEAVLKYTEEAIEKACGHGNTKDQKALAASYIDALP